MIWLPPDGRISTPPTPSWSLRERMMLIVSVSVEPFTGSPEVVRASKTSSVPLQVEAEMGLLRLDDARDPDADQERHEDQRYDEREDEGVAGSFAHGTFSGTA